MVQQTFGMQNTEKTRRRAHSSPRRRTVTDSASARHFGDLTACARRNCGGLGLNRLVDAIFDVALDSKLDKVVCMKQL